MIQIYESSDALMRAAADMFVERAGLATAESGRFAVALSGGETPKRAYELLGSSAYRERVKWDAVHVFWGDERCVPPDDPRSNYRMTRTALLDHIPIPERNIHRIFGELAPMNAASQYESELAGFFEDGPIGFDFILLGLGADGHTASLFPGTRVAGEENRLAAEVYVAKGDTWRVTLTAPVLNNAHAVAFLVSGREKAEALRDVLSGDREGNPLPAQLIKPAGSLDWLVDSQAAALLGERD